MLGLIPRSLAVCGIAGTLVFAVPVAAQADVWDTAWFELSAVAAEGGAIGGVVGEGVVAAAPVVADGFACAATLPLCAAVGGAVIGATLYLTKDTWLPWFTGGSEFTGPNMTYGFDSCVQDLKFLDSTLAGPGANAHWSVEAAVTSPKWPSACSETWTVTATQWRQSTNAVESIAPVVFTDNYQWNGSPPVYDVKTYQINATYDAASGTATTFRTMRIQGSGGAYIEWGTQPVATASLQVSCTNPDGSQYEVTSAVPSANGMVEMPTCTGKAGDLGGAKAKCATLSAGGSTSSMAVQSSNCVAAGTAGLLYPECMAAGCIYRVVVDGIACTVGRPGCSDWAAVYATSPGRVTCRYGEHAVSVDHCFFLERVYEDGLPVPATLGNTDGNPATWTGPTPLPNPGAQPQPQPIPNGAPGGAPGTLPGGGTAPLPSPGSDPSTNGDCWSGGSFSWNPVDWVMVPVKCALSWAFVPKTATLTQLSTAASTDLTTQGIGPIVNAVNVNVAKVGGGGGCDGPAVTFAAVGITKPMHPFSACTAPMSTLASISYAMTTVVVILGGGFMAVKAIGAGFGFNFSMRRGGGDSV